MSSSQFPLTPAVLTPRAAGGHNLGHGHVWPRQDGVKARCGGPGVCRECSRDQTIKDSTTVQSEPHTVTFALGGDGLYVTASCQGKPGDPCYSDRGCLALPDVSLGLVGWFEAPARVTWDDTAERFLWTGTGVSSGDDEQPEAADVGGASR